MGSEFVWRVFRKLPRKVKRNMKEVLRAIFKTSYDIPTLESQAEPWENGRPLLSVIVPCHNYGEFIRDALRSIQSQTYQGYEVIVVDDGSTDTETLEVLDQIREEGFRVLRFEDLGPAEAPNRGISIAKGKYICRLDSDDTLEPTYFEKCLSLMESNPGLAFAYTHLRAFGDEHYIRLAEPFNLRLLMNYNHINATAIFRKSAWEAVGGYDPSMRGYEDWEFWIRMGKSSFRGKLIPETLFNYRRHGPSLIDRSQKMHKALMRHIRIKHADLYSNPDRAEEIARSYRDYVVSDPFLNLSSTSQYARLRGRPVGLIIVDTLASRNNTNETLYGVLRSLESYGFLFVATDGGDRLSQESLDLPGYQYDLAAFLDSYCWLQFVVNLIETRSVQFVVISNSRLGYEWSQEIRARMQTPIVDVLHDLRSDYVNLSKRVDPFISYHIAFSEEVKNYFRGSEEKFRVLPTNLSGRENATIFRNILREAITANAQQRDNLN